MGLVIPIGQEAIYATQGNVAFPGTSTQLTAAQTFAATDIEAHVDDQSGSGLTITAAQIVAAR